MAGTFSKQTRPARAGAYFNWLAQPPSVVQPSVGSIVAIPFTSAWGPFKDATLVQSFQEYLAVFGPSVDSAGYRAAWMAFQGEGGIDGRFGAGAVLALRWGASDAAKASHSLQNSTAPAVKLTARYEGTYGNTLKVTTQDHAADATKAEMLLYLGATLVEKYVYLDADIADLVNTINGRSDWITAELLVGTTALAVVSSAALTGGDDGGALTAGDWTDIMSALESERYGVFVPFGLVDDAILASIADWAAGAETANSQGLNTKGRRFETVVGGAADEQMSDAIARSEAFNDGNFVNLGMSSFQQLDLPDVNGAATVSPSCEFAARFAGVLAGRGEAMSATFARFPNVNLVAGTAPSETDILSALEGGVVAFSRDSDPDAPVHVESSLTTYTSTLAPDFPLEIYKNPKFMRIMQGIEQEFTDWATSTIIGKLPVNQKTRDEAIAEVSQRLSARESVGIVQPGFTVAVDEMPPPSDDDEFIALTIGMRFGRSVEQIYFTCTVG
jgi:hypothetical protein